MTNEMLNELMATQVMGWHKEGHALSGPYWAGELYIRDQDSWHPATDVNQALLALQKVTLGGRYDLQHFRTVTGNLGWYCWTEHDGGAWGDTAALAICHCCLKAVGMEVS